MKLSKKQRAITIWSFFAGFILASLAIFFYISSLVYSPFDYLENYSSDDNLPADKLLEDAVNEALSTEHGAARDEQRYYQRLDLICRSYPSLCDKVSLIGSFSLEDSFFYKSIAIFVIARLDKYYDDWSLDQTIKKMSITDKWWRRWVAWWSQLTINTDTIKDYKEYLEIVVHELWHVIDLGLIQWSSSIIHQRYTEFGKKVFAVDDPSIFFYQLTWESEQVRKSWVDKHDFCSGYWQTNPFEDMSECFNLYMDHNALFRHLAQSNDILKQKYNVIADFFWGKYLYDSQNDLSLVKGNEKFFVFDTTKIAWL